MRHSALVNPFNLITEAPQARGEVPNRGARSTPVCSNCSSDDIL